MTVGTPTPGLARRLACALYESLLVLALLIVAGLLFTALTLSLHLPPESAKPLLWAYSWLVAGAYFALFWCRGQTLAMKTWGIRVETIDGKPPARGRAWLRYLLASLNLALVGIGWWWAWFDRDRQFLHDHLAGTRLVRSAVPSTRA
jgi:uncharacterized RDD family membrane protein YckC